MGPYGAHLHDGSEYDGSYADTTSIQVNTSIIYSLLSRKSGQVYNNRWPTNYFFVLFCVHDIECF